MHFYAVSLGGGIEGSRKTACEKPLLIDSAAEQEAARAAFYGGRRSAAVLLALKPEAPPEGSATAVSVVRAPRRVPGSRHDGEGAVPRDRCG